MKKLIVLFIISLAVMVYATADFREHKGVQQISVSTDSAADSTNATGTFGSFITDGYSTLQADIVIGNALPTYAGLGNIDSAWIRLYTRSEYGSNIVIDSVSGAGLPVTMTTSLHSNVGDTLIKKYLSIGYTIYDSLGDTTIAVNYPIKYSIKLK